VTPRRVATKFHRLWKRVQDLHLEAAAVLDQLASDDPCGRLALELALHDLLALSARAATLATFIASYQPGRRNRKKP
jgi:hypothetical protein